LKELRWLKELKELRWLKRLKVIKFNSLGFKPQAIE
jgi:hypothetical protein